MFEVEAKVPLNRSQLKRLECQLSAQDKAPSTALLDDTYYVTSNGVHIRLRRTGTTHVFTIKRRQTGEGIETNTELEWGIKEPAKWRAQLKKLQLQPQVRKLKRTRVYRMQGFRVELNHVRGLGDYLEIEKMVSGKEEIKKSKEELISLFRQLGFGPKQFEKRPYLELLADV